MPTTPVSGRAVDLQKGVEVTRGPLRQFATHPSHSHHSLGTLSLKAMSLMQLGRKAEAEATAKQAVESDKQSPWCWQVYGNMLRANHNYEQAAKCYRNAFALDEVSGLCRPCGAVLVCAADLFCLHCSATCTGWRTRWPICRCRCAIMRVSWWGCGKRGE